MNYMIPPPPPPSLLRSHYSPYSELLPVKSFNILKGFEWGRNTDVSENTDECCFALLYLFPGLILLQFLRFFILKYTFWKSVAECKVFFFSLYFLLFIILLSDLPFAFVLLRVPKKCLGILKLFLVTLTLQQTFGSLN